MTTDAPKKPGHTITLDRESARWLGELIGGGVGISPSKDPSVLVRVGMFAETHLSDLTDAPEMLFSAVAHSAPPEELARFSVDMKAYRASLKAWRRTELDPIGIGEKTREALKAILKDASAAGVMTGSFHHVLLLSQFGLAPEDD